MKRTIALLAAICVCVCLFSWAGTTRLDMPLITAVDANGDPGCGMQMFVYEAGTTTKVNLFKDAALSSAHTNPVVLNASGRPAGDYPIYTSHEGDVKMVLAPTTDTDPPTSPIYTVDDFSGALDSIDPEDVDDTSGSTTEMRVTEDPYPGATESTADDLEEEVWQLRHLLAQITGETYWYIDPDTTIANLNTYDVMTTRGDIIVEGAAAPGRVALGNAGQMIKSDGTDLAWGVSAGLVGYVNRASFESSTDTAFKINPGAYHHSGTTEQVVYWNSQLTFTAGSVGSNGSSNDLDAGAFDIQYIYLDDSAIVTQASPLLDADCFLNSDTAPTWSVTKHGWYNGSDRCIFAVTVDATDDLLLFYHAGGDYVQYDAPIEDQAATADIDDTLTDVALSIPSLGDNAQAIVEIVGVYAAAVNGGDIYWRKNGGTATKAIGNITGNNTPSISIIRVTVDSTQKIEIALETAGNCTLAVHTEGFFLPRGM